VSWKEKKLMILREIIYFKLTLIVRELERFKLVTFISFSIFALSNWDKLVSFNKKENRRIRIVLFDLIQSLFLVSYEEKLMFDSIW